jgi:hypothetical protein
VDLFSESVNEIEQAYEALGHRLGWRFLYSPANTLSVDTRLMFSGINPGGAHYGFPVPSVEAGNAYRIERWGSHGQPNGLQAQVRLLYEGLAGKLDQPVTNLMDATLATNFCPFRSPSWDRLPSKVESVAFSERLWSTIFGHISRKAIICLTGTSFDHYGEVLARKGFRRTSMQREPVGWGHVTYSSSRYDSGSGNVLMVRLPHLSRYKVFGRPQSQDATDRLTDAIVQALEQP